MGENFSSGTTPLATNPTRIIEVKILNALNGGAGGGGGGGGASFLSGVGPPTGVANATAVGQTYWDTSGLNFWIANATGTANWAEVIGN